MRKGWRYASNLGAYGENHLLASTVAVARYGANIAEEAMYLPIFTDHQGQPFTSDASYRIVFPGDNLPPAEAFWSITLYSLPDNQLRENPIDRYAIGDRTPTLKQKADGSIEIYIQQAQPEQGADNWLPTGGKGNFWMIMRLYRPGEKALSGIVYTAGGGVIDPNTVA